MQKAAYDAVDKMIRSLEKKLLTGYRATQTALKDEVGKFYLTYLTGIPAEDHKIVAQQYNRLKALNKKFQGTYMAFGSDTYRQLKDGQLELFEEMYYRSQYTLSTFSDVTSSLVLPFATRTTSRPLHRAMSPVPVTLLLASAARSTSSRKLPSISAGAVSAHVPLALTFPSASSAMVQE